VSNPSEPNPPAASDPRTQPAGEPAPADFGFEERLHQFWERRKNLILGVCIGILLVIVGVNLMEWMERRRAQARADAYAAASTDDQLRAFAAEHSRTQLGGVAYLRLGDQAYEAGRWSDAIGAYEQARESLRNTGLAGRARLGLAMTRLKLGQTDGGRSGLEEIANDTGIEKPLRAEAAYHLATLAAAAGNPEEVNRYAELITAVDPMGMWAQRAMMLRATVAQPVLPTAPTDEVPGITFPGARP
jgi:hypothetical protein